MKRHLIILTGLLTYLCVCSSCNKQNWQIEGRLEGNVNGNYVFLQYADTSRILIDSAFITDNSFTFKGQNQGIRLANLTIGKTYKKRNYRIALPLFLEKGQIHIQADYDRMTNSRNSFESYILSGTPSNQIFMDYINASQHFDQADSKVFELYGDHLMNKSGDHSRAYLNRGIQLTQQIDSLNEARVSYTQKYINEHRNSEAAFYLITKILASLSVEQIETLTSWFPESVKQSVIGQTVLKQTESVKLSAEGALYTDFQLSTPEQETRHLSDYIGKGEYVLLECWASWCGPCKRDIPHVKEVLAKYGPKGFRVVGISMDTDREAWKKAIAEHNIPWVQLSNLEGFNGQLTRTYKIRGIPTCILLDPQGKIIMRNARGSWLDHWLIRKFGDLFDKE